MALCGPASWRNGPAWARGRLPLKPRAPRAESTGVSRLLPRRAPIWRLALCLVPAVGCDATNYVEGVVQWRSADGVYGVEYVTPPWEVVEDDGVGLRLEIAPELFGAALQGSPPTHVLSLGPVDAEDVVADLLPEGVAVEDAMAPDADTDTGAVPDDGGSWRLPDIDLAEPRLVALAELDMLVTERRADLVTELAQGEGPGAPWSYEVVLAPGVFVRGDYFEDDGRTIRALFGSLFTLTDGDVSQMAATITVGGARR